MLETNDRPEEKLNEQTQDMDSAGEQKEESLLNDSEKMLTDDSSELAREEIMIKNETQNVSGEESELAEAIKVPIEEESADSAFERANSPPPSEPFAQTEQKPSSPTSNVSDEQKKILSAANDAALLKNNIFNQIKSLPWRPKVRLGELEAFLDQVRKKFLGYGDLKNDLDTLIGLPNPIHESIRILKQHLYISLGDEQIKHEEKLNKYPLSFKPDESDEQHPCEFLYSYLYPNLPQYLVIIHFITILLSKNFN